MRAPSDSGVSPQWLAPGAEAGAFIVFQPRPEKIKKRRTNMKDPKDKVIPAKIAKGCRLTPEEYRERLNREDMERHWHLEAIDHILSECEECPEKFHEHWIKPLVAAGVSPETAFSLLAEGRFQPN